MSRMSELDGILENIAESICELHQLPSGTRGVIHNAVRAGAQAAINYCHAPKDGEDECQTTPG